MKTSVFSAEALARVVSESLPTDAKPGEKVVIGTVDQHGAQVVAAFKSDSGAWEFMGAARHEWTGDNNVGAKVLYRW